MAFWRQDLTYAFRRLSKSPGVAAAAVVSIGLGIAANSTIFSMVSTFLLRPAPAGDPARLMSVHALVRGDWGSNFSWPLYTDLRDRTQSFSGVATWFDLTPASIGGRGEPERVWGQLASSNFFDVAQLRMTLGRGFAAGEESLPVIVLSHRLWQRRFGADTGIAGKTISVSGRPFTVVGVAPPAFRGLDILNSDFWAPLGNTEQLAPNLGPRSRAHNWLEVVARLKPGVTRAQAAAELGVLGRRLANDYPEAEKDRGFHLGTAGLLPPKLMPMVRMFLGALTVVVLLVLGIACANVANLLLAQASGRQREMAVRLALGATRAQLLRQLLTESVLLALGGGLFGVCLTLWATQALSSLNLPVPVPMDVRFDIDWKVLLYTFVLSGGTGLLFGLAPAWVASRTILSSALKGEDFLSRPGSRWTLSNILVVAQIAMSMVLLCATGLFLRSLQSAAGIDIGFRSHGILMMAVDPRLHGYTSARTTRFLIQLRQRVSALPGVTSAAFADFAPLSLDGRRDSLYAEGRSEDTGRDPGAYLYMVSPGYFETLGIPLIAGRDFAGESASAPKVAVVNEALARRFFPNENAIGQRVRDGGRVYRIIGVVKNAKYRSLGEDLPPVLYRAIEQDMGLDPSQQGYSLLIHSAGDSAAVAAAVRREIRSMDPTMAVFAVQTMEEQLRGALFLPRLASIMFAAFGLVGLLLAAVGLYGVVSYSVSRRTREIGIRLALGAQTGGVQRLIVRHAMALTAIAAAVGLTAAWAVARLASAILYGVRPHDWMTFTVVPSFLSAVALVACWIPARRAAKVDPLVALRHE